MKVIHKFLVATAFAAFGAGAIAQEATPDSWFPAVGTPKSRSQVLVELEQARRAGTIQHGEITRDIAYHSHSDRTREQVRAEVLAARASGELDAIRGEAPDTGPQHPTVYATAGSNAGR